MSDVIDGQTASSLEDSQQDGQQNDTVDYKAKYEESQKEIEQVRRSQSGSDRRVSELEAKIKELELASLSEKEKEKKLQEQRDQELAQLRQESLLNKNKSYALEQLSKAELDPQLVDIINLNQEQVKIIESVDSLKKVVDDIRQQAIDSYKKEHKPGFTPSASYTNGKKLTVDELMKLARENPDAYQSLPEDMKKPEKKQPLRTT